MILKLTAAIKIDDDMEEEGYGKPISLTIGLFKLDSKRPQIELCSFNGTDVENISPDLINLESWQLEQLR